VPRGGASEVDAAVKAARAAFPAWRATSLSKRTEILFRIRNLVEAHRADIAGLLTAEHGKVPSDALGDLPLLVLAGIGVVVDPGPELTVATEQVSVDHVSCGKPAAKNELRVRPLAIVAVPG